MVSLTPDTHPIDAPKRSQTSAMLAQGVCDFSQTEENPNSALP